MRICTPGGSTPKNGTEGCLRATIVLKQEQIAVATRDDLPAYDELPAARYLKHGDLHPDLAGAAEVLDDFAHLVGEVAAGCVERSSDGPAALEVEAQRITHSAARVRTLADEVEAAE